MLEVDSADSIQDFFLTVAQKKMIGSMKKENLSSSSFVNYLHSSIKCIETTSLCYAEFAHTNSN